jgi:hypothetical protein
VKEARTEKMILSEEKEKILRPMIIAIGSTDRIQKQRDRVVGLLYI